MLEHTIFTVSEPELLDKLKGFLSGRKATLFAYFTNRADCVESIDEIEMSTLLELRAFDKSREFKAARSTLGADFSCRIAEDNDFECKYMYDECHYLDIDSKKAPHKDNSSLFSYRTIGGGAYRLPVENADKIHIRYYLTYDNAEHTGQVFDYRIVEILPKGAAK